MRIAFHAPMKAPNDPVPSGEGRMAGLFIRALEEAGFAVEVASAFRAYEGRGDAARQAAIARAGAAEAARILERLRRDPPALWFTYHLYHKAPDHLGPVIARDLAIPYVVAEASHAPKQAGGPWAAGYRVAERAIRQASRIFCLNPADRACLEPLAGPDVLRDLDPFIDTAPFRARDRAAARAALEAAFALAPDRPLILAVAMMRPDQKLESYRVLAQALAQLRPAAFQALLVGDGAATGAVREAFAPLGARAVLAGRLEGEALIEAYAGADLYAWPSVKEAFGLSFIEAAASGLAVVAGRSGGIDRILAPGETGLVVPAGDASALRDGLFLCLGDPDLVRRMGEAGRERARMRNDVAAAATVLAADLRALVAPSRKRADR